MSITTAPARTRRSRTVTAPFAGSFVSAERTLQRLEARSAVEGAALSTSTETGFATGPAAHCRGCHAPSAR
jgi:hypothetical protein